MAKQSKKLTRDQKELLERSGYEPCVTRFVEDRDGSLIFIDINTGKEFSVEKEEPKKSRVIVVKNESYFESGRGSEMKSFEYNLFT